MPLTFAIACAGNGALMYLASFRGTTPIWRFNQGESGLWLDQARRVLDGAVMYRDFFDHVGPGIVYSNAFFLSVLGSSAAAAQTIPLIIGLIITGLIWRISNKLLSGAVMTLLPSLLFGLVYATYNAGNHKWLTWMFGLAAVDLLVARRVSLGRAVGAGACGGAAMLCTQDLGAQIGVGMLIALSTRAEWRACGWFLTGAAAVLVPVLAVLISQAGMATIWYDLIWFNATQYGNANGGFSLAPYFSWVGLPLVVFQWCLALAAIVAGVVLVSRDARAKMGLRDPDPRWTYVAWPGLTVLFLATLTPGRAIEPTQTTVRCTLLLIAVAGALDAASSRLPRPKVLAVAGALAIAALTATTTIAIVRQLRATTLVNTRAGPVWFAEPPQGLEWLQQHTIPGESTFLFPDKGGVYFLTVTRNATVYPFLLDMDFSTPAQVSDAIAQLARAQPRVGLFDLARLGSGGITNSSLAPLYEFLLRHYRTVDGVRFELGPP